MSCMEAATATPSPASAPRGPRAPALVQVLQLYRDPIGYLERCRDRWGPVFRIDYPGAPPLAYVTDPSLARQLYSHDGDVNRAGEARLPYLGPLVGESSLLCLEGESWRRQRALLAPPLHGDRVGRWSEAIGTIAAAEIDSWGEVELELRPRMQAITLEVILRLVFGVGEGARRDRLRELLPALLDAIDSPVFGLPRVRRALAGGVGGLLPRNPVRRFQRLRASTDAEIHAEIARRREGVDEVEAGSDLLSMLIAARDERGEAMSDGELRDELVTLLTAGHETTATALAWTFERAVRHPAVLERLVAEADAGDDTTYLDAVIREVLRTRPVVFDTPRNLEGPIELGDRVVPGGWWAAAAIPLVHESRELIADPERFDPDRFLGADPPVRGWIPFGGGRRRCLGSRLALLELQTVVPAVLRKWRLSAPEAAGEEQRIQHVTLAPAKRALVRLAPR